MYLNIFGIIKCIEWQGYRLDVKWMGLMITEKKYIGLWKDKHEFYIVHYRRYGHREPMKGFV